MIIVFVKLTKVYTMLGLWINISEESLGGAPVAIWWSSRETRSLRAVLLPW